MNSFYEYFAARQKLAAYRQAKRLQRGVKLGENQSVAYSTTVKFVSNPITIGTGDFSVEFYGTMYGQNSSYASLFNAASPSAGGDKTFSFYSQYYPNNGIYGVLFSPDTGGDSLGDQVVVQYEQEDDSKFLISVTRQGTTVKVYINGELKATKEQSEVKDLGDLQLAIANSSDVGFVRVWNYALSADDVTAHYNNGDPMGYVVPKSARRFEVSYNSDFSTGVDGWKGTAGSSDLTVQSNNGVLELSGNYSTYQISRDCGLKPKYASAYKVRIEFEEPITAYRIRFYPFSAQAVADVYPSGPITVFEAISSIKDENLSASCYLYIYGLTPNTVVRIKSISAYPVGLLAEYLPQNLMGQKERPLQIISENSYTWDNVTTGALSLDIRTNPGIKTGVTYKVNLTVSGFSEGEPYLYAGSRVSIPAANGTYGLLVTPSGDYDYISVYGGTNIQLKNLTITVNKVEVANVATSWLDSAKQLPLSDEYMEPLFQSIGGYDMAANGAPEIIYNE